MGLLCYMYFSLFSPLQVIVEREESCAQYGMVAIEDIEEGECLFQIPRKNLLNPETSGIAKLLQEGAKIIKQN